jgi:glycosyltransferase involved in cell wall biosynthesis
VYNASDVGLNTSEGEGWGLASFEHAATGAAQIVPGHSGMEEVWGGAADMLPASMQVTAPGTLGTSQLIAPTTVAAALQRLYRDPELLVSRSLDAYRKATEPRYSWDVVAREFDGVLAGLIRPRPAGRPLPIPDLIESPAEERFLPQREPARVSRERAELE